MIERNTLLLHPKDEGLHIYIMFGLRRKNMKKLLNVFRVFLTLCRDSATPDVAAGVRQVSHRFRWAHAQLEELQAM